LPLARLGFEVTGIDNSKVGIDQMQKTAQQEKLNITAMIGDLYEFEHFHDFDYILLDSMFHFLKKDKAKEVGLIQKIRSGIKRGAFICICIPDTDQKVKTLLQAIPQADAALVLEESFTFTFEDTASGHSSHTPHKLFVWKK
jgi:2-polyprenyl-3-methyl-5-hydroxy-6-metoxy-1,4-benzoquinol methylase